MYRLISVVGLCAAFTLACGGIEDEFASASGGDPGVVKSSCDHIQGYSECGDNFDDAYLLGEDMLRTICGIVDGNFQVDTACPTANRVGACDDGVGTTNHYYSVGEMPFTTESAKADCVDDDGTWVP